MTRQMGAVVKEYLEQKTLADRDPMAYPKTMAGIAAAGAQAKDQMKLLEKEAWVLLKANAVAIFLSGTPEAVEEFASIAKREFDSINVDASVLIKRVAAKVEPSFGVGGSRQFGAHQAGLMITGLRDVAVDLGIRNMDAPRHKSLPVTCTTPEDTIEYLRKTLRETVGDDLTKMALEKDITMDALLNSHVNPSVPVLILNSAEEEIPGLSTLFTREPVTLQVEPGSSKESVLKSFNSIKKSIGQKR